MKRKSFKVLVFTLVIALMSVSSVNASKGEEKAPNWKSAAVTKEDISALKEYEAQNSGFEQLLTDKQLITDLQKGLTANAELLAFTGLKESDLKKAYANSSFAGKSQNAYDVYYSNFELNGVSILTTYDLERDLLLDAFITNHTDNSNVTSTSRNLGLLLEAPLADFMKFKNGSQADQEDFKKKYKRDLVTDNGKKSKETAFSALWGPQTANAADDWCGDGMYSSQTCSWIGVVYCASAGLLGFWPGLICAVTFTYGCNTCS